MTEVGKKIYELVVKWNTCPKFELMKDMNNIRLFMTRYKHDFKESGYENCEYVLGLANEIFNIRFQNRSEKVA